MVREVTRLETLSVLGEPVEYNAHLYHCDVCKKEFASESQEDRNFEVAYDIYRQRHNLLRPAQIKALRDKYGLSQTNLALLLGWGEITVHRYENGSLQDVAHNELLVLLEDAQNVRKILDLNKARLPEPLIRKLGERLDVLLSKERNSSDCLLDCLQHVPLSESDISTGYRAFDLNKFDNVILYLLHKCADVYKTKLNKLLWYCDFRHFQNQKVSLTGTRYVHLPFGPVPDNYEVHLWRLRSQEKIKSVEKVFRSCAGELLVPLVDVEPKRLTATELKTIDEVVNKLGGLTAKALSDKSHKEPAYIETGDTETIPYTYADSLSL
jgi:putative zinc finger/helix-turn-helix YgiT family protein